MGIVLQITRVLDIKDGTIIPGDGAAFHDVVFEALVYLPSLHEIVDGEVVEVVEFGAFVRFGPFDGLVHVSQLIDDYIVYDKKRMALLGKESHKALMEGDNVRARVVAVSINPEKSKESKINLTMRQPGLGKFEWIEEAKDKAKKKKSEKVEKKPTKEEKK